jgi:hypothetical protein
MFSSERRKFLCRGLQAVGVGLGSCWISTVHAIPGTVSEEEKGKSKFQPKERTPAEQETKNLAFDGCSLKGNFSKAFGGKAPQLYSTSGNHWMDGKLNAEYQYLCFGFQVRPMWYMYNDTGSPNAFATPNIIGNHNMPNGTVCFGKKMFAEILRKFGPQTDGEVAAMAVTAHEWAHIVQFQVNSGNHTGKYPELHADFMSGWYMANRWKQQWGMINLESAMQEMWSIGDFAYNDKNHHGTPKERLSAFRQGASVGQANGNLQQAFAQGKLATGY